MFGLFIELITKSKSTTVKRFEHSNFFTVVNYFLLSTLVINQTSVI